MFVGVLGIIVVCSVDSCFLAPHPTFQLSAALRVVPMFYTSSVGENNCRKIRLGLGSGVARYRCLQYPSRKPGEHAAYSEQDFGVSGGGGGVGNIPFIGRGARSEPEF